MASSTSQTGLISVARTGTELISRITSYLSTLPHPIEIVEELVSVVAVTTSLLTSLQSVIDRFPNLELSSARSFLNPLSQDILSAISELDTRFADAQRMRVFEPNDVGLVRLPRNAWILVNGSEAKARSLKSRLYVEKYRVRVLIDAVNWYGLRSLETKIAEEEEEYQQLRGRLGLIAERLVGVWKDYTPRIRALENRCSEDNAPSIKGDAETIGSNFETYMLRRRSNAIDSQLRRMPSQNAVTNYPESPPRISNRCYTMSGAGAHFLDKLQAHKNVTIGDGMSANSIASKFSLYRSQSQAFQSTAYGDPNIRKRTLKLPDDAQWEIQKLIEGREASTGEKNAKRKWAVVDVVGRPRRLSNQSSFYKRRRWHYAYATRHDVFLEVRSDITLDPEFHLKPNVGGQPTRSTSDEILYTSTDNEQYPTSALSSSADSEVTGLRKPWHIALRHLQGCSGAPARMFLLSTVQGVVAMSTDASASSEPSLSGTVVLAVALGSVLTAIMVFPRWRDTELLLFPTVVVDIGCYIMGTDSRISNADLAVTALFGAGLNIALLRDRLRAYSRTGGLMALMIAILGTLTAIGFACRLSFPDGERYANPLVFVAMGMLPGTLFWELVWLVMVQLMTVGAGVQAMEEPVARPLLPQGEEPKVVRRAQLVAPMGDFRR